LKTYEISKNKPKWLKSNIPQGKNFTALKNQARESNLFTVCEEAKCPNLSECWQEKTATMMILGDTCTRACRFCHVKTGNPKGRLDPYEAEKAVEMVRLMDLEYLVLTSVDRDDLADFGAGQFAEVVSAIRQEFPETKVEVLIPDFNQDEQAMHTLAQSSPFVIAQNLETVERLTHPVRDPRAGYQKTLNCLQFYKKNYPEITTKTSIMVGLGETWEELHQAMLDLRAHQVDIITFGQYLQPTKRHLSVDKFYTPEEFAELKRLAIRLGFKFVASGPLVRSSYRAADYFKFLNKTKDA
jgi:lipoic acid synthetase